MEEEEERSLQQHTCNCQLMVTDMPSKQSNPNLPLWLAGFDIINCCRPALIVAFAPFNHATEIGILLQAASASWTLQLMFS